MVFKFEDSYADPDEDPEDDGPYEEESEDSLEKIVSEEINLAQKNQLSLNDNEEVQPPSSPTILVDPDNQFKPGNIFQLF